MATIRTLATAAAALCTALLLIVPDVVAEPLAGVLTGTPVKPSPPLKGGNQILRPEGPRKIRHVERHRTATAGRDTARPLNHQHIMRGADIIDLIARLPWWRPIEMQTIHYPDRASISQVLATADAWFATEFGEPGIGIDAGVRIVSADELNELDLATAGLGEPREPRQAELIAAYMPEKSGESWFQALLAMFAGALAAVSAARYLFV